jgi:hypothetical protein
MLSTPRNPFWLPGSLGHVRYTSRLRGSSPRRNLQKPFPGLLARKTTPAHPGAAARIGSNYTKEQSALSNRDAASQTANGCSRPLKTSP